MKQSLFWITGNHFDCSSFVNSLLSKLQDVNYVILDSTADKFEKVLTNLINRDLIDTRVKVVHLKGLHSDYLELVDFLKYIGKKKILVIESPLQFTISRKKFNVSTSKLMKVVKENGKFFDFKTVLPIPKATIWAKKVINAHKIEIEDEAVRLIAKLKNGVLDSIAEEILKLSTLDKSEINENKVRRYVAKESKFDNWHFIDMLAASNIDEALIELEEFFNKDGFVYEIDALLGGIAFKFELLLFARSCGSGCSLSDLKNVVLNIKKQSFSDKKDNKRNVKIVPKYSDGALRMFFYSELTKKAVQKNGTVKLTQKLSCIYFVQSYVRFLAQNIAKKKILLLDLSRMLCDRMRFEEFRCSYV